MQPTHRQSKARRGKRRSHDKLQRTHTVLCPNCGSPRLPHAACTNCGYVRPGLAVRSDQEEQ